MPKELKIPSEDKILPQVKNEVNEDKKKKTKPSSTPVGKDKSKNEGYKLLALATHSLPGEFRNDLRSISNASPQTKLIIEHFEKGDYEAVIQLYNQAKKENDFSSYKSYVAHAHFKLKDYNKAAVIFADLASNVNNSTAEIDNAEWNLVLSWLVAYSNNKSKVDNLLDKMIAPENYHTYATKATTLKSKLGSI